MSAIMQGSHSGAGPLNLMSCVRESSPLDDYETDTEKSVVSKRKFWNPKKWFRKKQKTSDDLHSQDIIHDLDGGTRSRSTSELSVDDDTRDDERRHSSSMHPGLSVSHDSVFHPLNSGSSDLELDGAQSSSSLSISQPLGDARLQSELSSKLRLRRGRGDTSEDDEGLPGSPLCGSPAATTDSYLILDKTANKDLPTKSHSTCSDGSLLSMDDSSEMDEDSIGVQSRHSSKISLHEKRIEIIDSDLELGPVQIQLLNHSAAHHRVSVRPKRTYGAPRRKNGQLSSALPATPEVNEESSVRSLSPEVMSRVGVSLPVSDSFRLKRSLLQSSGRSQDDASVHDEEKEEKRSFFERIFPRRSNRAKKKDDKAEEVVKNQDKAVYISSTSHQKLMTKSYTSSASHFNTKTDTVKPVVAPRTGAASRQRVQPIDIPMTPKDTQDYGLVLSSENTNSPEKSLFGSSPIQAELEGILKQRMSQQTPSSPLLGTPPISPRSPKRNLSNISKTESRVTHQQVKHQEFKQSDTSSGYVHKEFKKSSRGELTNQNINFMKSSRDDLQSLTTSDVSFRNRFCHEEFKRTKVSEESHVTDLNSHHEDLQQSVDNEIISSNQINQRISHQEDGKSNKDDNNLSCSGFELTTNESRIKIAGLSSLQKKVLSLNENNQNNDFKSLTDFSLKPSKVVTKSHSFKSKLEEKSSLEYEDELLHKRQSLKSASLESVKNLEEIPPLEHLINENKRTCQIENEKNEPEVLEVKNFMPNLINKIAPLTETITISGPSHTAIVNVTSSEEVQSTKTATQSENEKRKIVKESNVSVTKIHLKHEQTQVTRASVAVLNQEIPEFLVKQLNKVEIQPLSNVIFSMKSPKIINSEEYDEIKNNNSFNFHESVKDLTSEKDDKKTAESLKVIQREQIFSRPKSIELKSKPQFLRTPSKEGDFDLKEKTMSISSTVEKTETTKHLIIQTKNIKECIQKEETSDTCKDCLQENIANSINEETDLLRPKTLTNFSQRHSEKPVFLRSASKEDKPSKDNLPIRPKTLFNFPNNDLDSVKPVIVQSISKESGHFQSPKDPSPKSPPYVSVTPFTPTSGSKFIKNDKSSRRSSIINSSNLELNKNKSASLDSLISSKNDSSDKSSQDSLDKIDKKFTENVFVKNASQDSLDKIDKRSPTEGVILRRKSLHKQKDDDQPELMKVFARRSLKLKDEDIVVLHEALNEQTNDSEHKLKDSDKENNLKTSVHILDAKEQNKDEENTDNIRIEAKKPLVETKKTSDLIKNTSKDEPEVQLRRPFTHNIFLSQRAQSLNPPKTNNNTDNLKKQTSLRDNRKTDNWITVKKCEEKMEKETAQIIENIDETKTETKNFRQRKAEWEKRVQQFNK